MHIQFPDKNTGILEIYTGDDRNLYDLRTAIAKDKRRSGELTRFLLEVDDLLHTKKMKEAAALIKKYDARPEHFLELVVVTTHGDFNERKLLEKFSELGIQYSLKEVETHRISIFIDQRDAKKALELLVKDDTIELQSHTKDYLSQYYRSVFQAKP